MARRRGSGVSIASLNMRAGGIFFPNQNFQGGDELTERGQEPLYLNGGRSPHDSPVLGKNWYSTYLWTDFALKFVDEAKKAGKPFFLYIPHNAPHFPLMAPPELIAKYRGRYKAGWDRLRNARYARQIEMGMIRPVGHSARANRTRPRGSRCHPRRRTDSIS